MLASRGSPHPANRLNVHFCEVLGGQLSSVAWTESPRLEIDGGRKREKERRKNDRNTREKQCPRDSLSLSSPSSYSSRVTLALYRQSGHPWPPTVDPSRCLYVFHQSTEAYELVELVKQEPTLCPRPTYDYTAANQVEQGQAADDLPMRWHSCVLVSSLHPYNGADKLVGSQGLLCSLLSMLLSLHVLPTAVRVRE